MKPTELLYDKIYIDGKWVKPSVAELTEVENPANGSVIAKVPNAAVEDAQKALESSQRAFYKWKTLPPIERAKFLYAIIEKMQLKRDFFAELVVKEQGKILPEAYGEFDDTLNYLRYSAEAARRIKGEIFPSDNPHEQLWIQRVPYGVVAGLCAFNYPLALIGRKVGPALVTGNTIVLKPHEATPLCTLEFCKILDEVGLPAGVINVVTGAGATVGSHLVSSPITKLVTVTGSIRAGQAIYKAASENVTALCLELGGKAPFIVLEDADLDKAVEAAVISRYANCGQVCICNEMVLVHKKVAKAFTERVVERVKKMTYGDPMTQVSMGPTVTASGLRRVEKLIEETIAQGATLLCGGKRPDGAQFAKGNWYEPTVISGVTADMPLAKEEIFAPVLPIVEIDSYEQALEISNARDDGLSAYLWTEDYHKIMDAVENLETGTIFVNKMIVGYIQGYHNGHKKSGLGGEDGIHGIEGYLQKKTIYLNY